MDTLFVVRNNRIRAFLFLTESSASNEPAVYKVVTPTTHKSSDPLPEDVIYRINTGAPLPLGTNTVIMVEDTRLVSTIKDEDGHDVEEQEVETLVSVPKGENVREPGSDTRKGDLALPKGTVLRSTGGEIGTLAFAGRREVESYLWQIDKFIDDAINDT